MFYTIPIVFNVEFLKFYTPGPNKFTKLKIKSTTLLNIILKTLEYSIGSPCSLYFQTGISFISLTIQRLVEVDVLQKNIVIFSGYTTNTNETSYTHICDQQLDRHIGRSVLQKIILLFKTNFGFEG